MNKENKKDDLGAVRVLVEILGPFEKDEQERIIRWAREKLGLTAITSSQPVLPSTNPVIVSDSKETTKTSNIKSFVDGKDPKNDKQFASVVAYYYAFESPESQRKASIDSKDLIEACRLTQRKRPINAGQTLINAAHSGFLDKAEEAGRYKLNPVGENLVAMTLPSGEEKRRGHKTSFPKDKNKKTKLPQKKKIRG